MNEPYPFADLGQVNRWVGWLLLPPVVITTVALLQAFYANALLTGLPSDLWLANLPPFLLVDGALPSQDDLRSLGNPLFIKADATYGRNGQGGGVFKCTDADDALFIARTVRDGDFTPLQPGNQDTEQLKLVCRQRRFITHELANAKRRLTGLIDLSFPEFGRHFDNNRSQAARAVLKAAPSAAAIARLSLRRLGSLLMSASHCCR